MSVTVDNVGMVLLPPLLLPVQLLYFGNPYHTHWDMSNGSNPCPFQCMYGAINFSPSEYSQVQ